MAKNFKTGLIISGDSKGGVKAVRSTSDELRRLNSDFSTGSKRAQSFSSTTRETSRELEFLKRGALGAGAALAGAFAANKLGQQATMIRDTQVLANTLDTSTKTLQEWQYAGQQVGIQADKVGDIFKDVSDKIGDFSANQGGEAKDLFEKMNLDIQEMVRLSPDQQLLKISESLGKLNASERTHFMESLADDASRLTPLLEDNGRLLRQYSEDARSLGVAMDEVEVSKAVEAADAMGQLKGVSQGLTNTLVADLGPGLAETTQGFTTYLKEAGGAAEVMDDVTDVVGGLAAILAGRLVGSLAETASGFVKKTAASIADAKAEATATQQVARRTAAERTAAMALLASAKTEEQATRGTAAHGMALRQLSVARARATEAAAAHTTATNTATAAMSRASVVSRGLRGALSLMGGPLGLLVGGSGLLLTMSDNSDTAASSVDSLRQSTDEFTESLKSMTTVQASASLVRIGDSIDETRAKLKDASADVSRLRGELEGKGPVSLSDDTRARKEDELALALERRESAQNELNKSLERQNKLQQVANGAWEDAAESSDKASDGVRRVSNALGTAGEEWNDYIGKLESARAQLGMNAQQSAEYAAQQEGHTGLYAELSGAVAGQTSALQQYQSAIKQGNDDEAQVHLARAQRLAEEEAMIQSQLSNLSTLNNLLAGTQSNLSATALSAAMVVDDSSASVSARIEQTLAVIRQRAEAIRDTTTVTSEASKEADKAAEELEKRLDSAQSTLTSLTSAMSPAGAAMTDYQSQISALSLLLEEGRINQLEYTAAIAGAATEYNNATEEADGYAKRVESLVDTYDNSAQQGKKLEKAVEDANRAYRNGDIDGAQYQRMLGNIRDKMRDLALESEPMAKEMARAWDEAADRIDETFADAFTGAFDSFDDFGDQLLDGFKQLLGELAYQATLKPIVVDFTAQARSALGIPGAGGGGVGGGIGSIFGGGSGGGGFGWGNLLSMGQSAWSAIEGVGPAIMSGYQSGGLTGAIEGGAGYYGDMAGGVYDTAAGALGAGSAAGAAGTAAVGYGGAGWAGSVGAGAYGGAGFAGSAAAGSASAGGMSGALSSAASAWPLAVVAGMYQSGKLYDQGVRPDGNRMRDIGDGNAISETVMELNAWQAEFFGGLDSLLEPLVGGKTASILTGSTFSQALWETVGTGLFGGTWQTQETGLELGASGNDLSARAYADQEKDGGWFGSDDHRTEYAELSSSANESLQQMYDSTVGRVRGYFDSIGAYVSDATVEGFETARKKLDTEDKSEEEIRKMVQDWFSQTSETLVDALNHTAIEDLDVDSLQSLSEHLIGVNTQMTKLGQELNNVSVDGAWAAEQLAKTAGGLQDLTSLQDQYFQSYYSQTEQAAVSFSRVYSSLGQITDQIPTTEAGFRRLVESQDRMTESGRAAYVQLLQIAPAFAEVAGSVREVITSVYQDVLGRQPDVAGLNYWVDQVESGAVTVNEALNVISDSAEATAASLKNSITEAYNKSLNREPDTEGLNYWIGQVESGSISLNQALKSIRNSSEAASVAADGAAGSIQNQADASRIAQQRASMEIEILRLQGREAEATRRERQAELDSMNDSLDPLQKRIWALEDAKEAEDEARQAAEDRAKAMRDAEQTIAGFSTSINDWLNQLRSTDQGMGTPDDQLGAAQSAWQTQLAAAQAGDRDALGSITQYADRYLDAAKGMYASGDGSQNVRNRIETALEKLPDQLSPEQFLSDEFSTTISAQTADLSSAFADGFSGTVTALSANFDAIDSNLDGLLTFGEIKRALGDRASDAQISALIATVDSNGDGMISAQELATASIGGLAHGIAQSLQPHFQSIDLDASGAINASEFADYFDGLATDATLDSVFSLLDINGDGQISELESIRKNTEALGALRAYMDSQPASMSDEIQDVTQLYNDILKRVPDVEGLDYWVNKLADGMSVGKIESSMRDSAEYQNNQGGSQSSGNSSSGGESLTARERGQRYLDRYPGILDAWEQHNEHWRERSGANGPAQFANWHAQNIGIDEGRKWATGGVFTNSIVDQPTNFTMNQMGEAGPEAIVPLAKAPDGRLGIEPVAPPVPSLPLLGQSDVTEAINDLRREVAGLRAENARLLGESNEHLGAANNQRGAAAKQQIEEQRRGNKSLDALSKGARLEASR